jgi:hypothetical protein
MRSTPEPPTRRTRRHSSSKHSRSTRPVPPAPSFGAGGLRSAFGPIVGEDSVPAGLLPLHRPRYQCVQKHFAAIVFRLDKVLIPELTRTKWFLRWRKACSRGAIPRSGSSHSEGSPTARGAFTVPGGPLDFEALGTNGQNVRFGATQRVRLRAVAKLGNVPLPSPGEQVMGGHAVMAVGYDFTAGRFLVLNS